MGIWKASAPFSVTTITWQRQPIFRYEAKARLLIDVLAHYRTQKKYQLHEFVIMPDHFHALLSPADDLSLERAMQFIKGGFSFQLRRTSKWPVWQASFTNHRIRDKRDYAQHREYIRMNPVCAGLATSAQQYPYSSASSNFSLDAPPPGLKPDFQRSA